MNGYIHSQEQQKAAQVRELIAKARQIWSKYPTPKELNDLAMKYYDEAEEYSSQLADYLKSNYPNNFKFHMLTAQYDASSDEESVLNYVMDLKIHDILVLKIPKVRRFYVIFNDNGNLIIFRQGASGMITLKGGAADFLEEMGLTSEAANKLYGLTYGNRYYLDSLELDKWPNKVKKSLKLK